MRKPTLSAWLSVPPPTSNSKPRSVTARAGLYKALGKDGNPSFGAVLKVIRAMGLEFHIAPQK